MFKPKYNLFSEKFLHFDESGNKAKNDVEKLQQSIPEQKVDSSSIQGEYLKVKNLFTTRQDQTKNTSDLQLIHTYNERLDQRYEKYVGDMIHGDIQVVETMLNNKFPKYLKPEGIEMTNAEWNALHPELQEYIINGGTDTLLSPIDLLTGGLAALATKSALKGGFFLIIEKTGIFLKGIFGELVPISMEDAKLIARIFKNKIGEILKGAGKIVRDFATGKQQLVTTEGVIIY